MCTVCFIVFLGSVFVISTQYTASVKVSINQDYDDGNKS